MKVAILIHSMNNSGGIERVAANLSHMFAENYIETELVVLNSCKEFFYDIDERVKVTNLGVERLHLQPNKFLSGIYSFEAINSIRKYMKYEKPDVMLAIWTDPAVYATIAKFGLGTKVVACEHTAYEARVGLWKSLRSMVYTFSDAVVSLTQRDTEIYKKINYKSYTIPNAVDIADLDKTEKEKIILAIGGIIHNKGFDLLIRAWEKIYFKFPDWKIKIIGAWREGEYGRWLQSEIDRLRLSSTVNIFPPTKNIIEEYRLSSILALSSRQEGLPMVLLEAMASGMASVAFDCPTGPSDIIKNNETGLLVKAEDVDEMAEALETLIVDQELREMYGEKARVDIRQRFGGQAIMKDWMDLFDKL